MSEFENGSVIEPEKGEEKLYQVEVKDRIENTPITIWYAEGVVFVEEELEVARALGFPEAEVERLRNEHATEDEYYAVAPARYILEAMEERYGVHFDVVELTEQVDRFVLELRAIDGPRAGEYFHCSMRGAERGSALYSDDYYGAAREGDYEEFVAGQVDEALRLSGYTGERRVAARLEQMVDQTAPMWDLFAGGSFDYLGTCAVALLGDPDDGKIPAAIDMFSRALEYVGAGADVTVSVYPKELPAGDAFGKRGLLAGAFDKVRGNEPVEYHIELAPDPALRLNPPCIPFAGYLGA